MNTQQEKALLEQLTLDETGRDRERYVYTIDALLNHAITPLAIWPESNHNIAAVIDGRLDYDRLPFDPGNEIHKGGLFTEQQDVILRHYTDGTQCEALDMKPCLEKKCPLYNPRLSPPVCREYKMAFRR